MIKERVNPFTWFGDKVLGIIFDIVMYEKKPRWIMGRMIVI